MIKIGNDVTKCISPSKFLPYHLSPNKIPNAWTDGKILVFTEGIFEFDDDILKFIMAHEIAHESLGHVAKAQGLSMVTTGVMLLVNSIIPGAGLLNHAVNPAIVNNYSKSQELEADKLASQACICMNIPPERQIEIMLFMKSKLKEAGGFWDRHPSWDERIKNISNSR